MARISPRTELLLAAFHFAHGSAASLNAERLRLQAACDVAKTSPDLAGKYDRQLLIACERALDAGLDDIARARAGVDEIMSLACADKSQSEQDAAILELALGRGQDLRWQDRADLR